MIKKFINAIKTRLALADLGLTNFQEETKDESGYVEKDFDCSFMTLEESRALKIRMLEDGIDLSLIFEDSKLFNANDKFDTTAKDFKQSDIDMFEAALNRRDVLKDKILKGERLTEKESFRRSK